MAPKQRAFSQLQVKQRSRIIDNLESIFKAHCPSIPDANLLLQQLFRKC